MTRLLLAALLVTGGAPAARGNATFTQFPNSQAPAKAPPPPNRAPVVAGVATTAGVLLAGLWLLRRRNEPRG